MCAVNEYEASTLAKKRWRISGGLTVALGAVVLFGWHAGIATLIQVHPSFVPMQYNTALCFLLCGLGVMFFDRRPKLTTVLASLAALIALLTLAEYIFGANWGLDQLFMHHYITVETSHPGRMAPNTALCFTLTGAALLAAARTKGRSVRTLGFLALLLIVLGSVALIGYPASLKSSYSWGGLTSMAVHTACGFVILGCGLFWVAWVHGLANHSVTATVSIFGAGAAIVLWHVVGLHDALEQAMVGRSDIAIVDSELKGTVTLVAVAGVLGTCAVALLIRQIHRNADLLEVRVAERTRELDSQKYALDEHAIVSITDPRGIITYANDNFCEISQYSREELIGQDHRMINSGHHPRAFFAELWKTISAGEVWKGDVCNRAKDGSLYWVDTTIVPFKDEAGHIAKYGVIRADITDRVQTETRLLDAERKSRAWLEYSPICTKIVDLDFNLQYMSTAGVTSLNIDDITPYYGKPYPFDFYPEIFRDTMTQNLKKVRDTGETTTQEAAVADTAGNTLWFHSTLVPVHDDCGRVEYIIVVSVETTERRRAEAALTKTLAVADAANQAKSEFLANMSHEIRTPMTAILGFAENLLDGDQSESEKLSCIHTIRHNGESLMGIINDILDLSKIEAGKMVANRISCEPCNTIAEVVSLVRVQTTAKGLPLNIEYEGAIPKTILTDPTWLRQILINLVANAVKFTETGSVRLVTRLVDDGDKPCLQFDVVDTGLGMTQEQVTRLFQPFMQADTSSTRKFGGTGLGLTISKRFAELLGGDIIVVDTELGAGSTFRATVAIGSLDGIEMLIDPISATVMAEDANAVTQTTRADLQGLRILLAEDGPDNQRLISFFLKKAGADVTVEENGKLALDSALAARDGDKPFDVILMDMQMPVMDGYEATGQLRRKGYTRPIIALTAHAMVGDREKCIKAGCDDYVTKPIDRKKLIDLILACVQDRQPKVKIVQVETPERLPLTGCRILLAEDNPTNQVLVVGILKKVDAEITAVKDGKLALDAALAARDNGKPFDIILMDIQMPLMGGVEATKLLREKRYTGKIISLTADTQDGDRQQYISMGFDDSEGKPINRARLIETIKHQWVGAEGEVQTRCM